MKSLKDLAVNKQANQVKSILEGLFKGAKEDPAEYNMVINDADGTVDVDGYTFGYIEAKLRMKGFCANCGMDAWSLPIRKFADIADQINNFRAMPHDCMGD